MSLVVRVAVAIVVALATLLGGYAIADSTHADASTALGPGLVTVTVDIHYSKFSVSTVTVRQGTTVRFLVRLLVATGVAAFASWGMATVLPGYDDPSHLLALLRLVLVGGANVLVFLVLARLMRLTEVNEVIDTVTRRLRRPTTSSR